MPRKKKIEGNVFLLLEKETKTYAEFSDKKELVEELAKLIESGKNPDDFVIVPKKELSFYVGYTVSIQERAPRKKKRTRKPRKARKPRKVLKIRKPRKDRGVKRGRRPKVMAEAEPVAEVKTEAKQEHEIKIPKKRGRKPRVLKEQIEQPTAKPTRKRRKRQLKNETIKPEEKPETSEATLPAALPETEKEPKPKK